ncbi:MAG: Asp-tRNA(Asn)/Glu-tRNA(Gln) amidotransferase subunit GatC [Clostridia bacterium]|nr:Asp-tRNA(Asn)/Glu-tRNA(Gln) amidotransferase subunit GatC [Clostridia bacterium]
MNDTEINKLTPSKPDLDGHNTRPRIDVEHIAELAALRLTEGEKEAFRRDMDSISEFIQALAELHTECSDTRQPPKLESFPPLRNDIPRSTLDRSDFLEGAPSVHDGYVSVPRVLSEGD